MEKADLNKLRTFYFVALEGSYKKASTHLGVQTPNISKQITALEAHFKTKLFKRARRSLILTSAGSELMKTVQVIMNKVEELEEFANVNSKTEDDTLRIITTTGVTVLWLIRKLKDFVHLYPKYRLRIITIDEDVDISNHFADVAILPKINADPNITQKKLLTVTIKLFASKQYLETFGIPEKPEDLDNHRLISFYHNQIGHRGNVDWHLRIGTKKDPRIPFLVINSAIGLFEAASQGLGIIAISEEFPYIKSENLINVLPNEQVAIPVYFAVTLDKVHLPKVVALDKFLFKQTQTGD